MEKDVVQIRCLSDNERYADLINGVVFGGRQVVHGEDIREMDSQTGLRIHFPNIFPMHHLPAAKYNAVDQIRIALVVGQTPDLHYVLFHILFLLRRRSKISCFAILVISKHRFSDINERQSIPIIITTG